jgi:DNA-binding response OmpR family regulator
MNDVTERGTPRPRHPTILVVDDDPDMLSLCATQLGAAGFSVLTAVGSLEAQLISDRYPATIDLVLLDLLLYPPTV